MSATEEAAADPASDIVTYTSADTVHRGDTLAGLLLRNRIVLLGTPRHPEVVGLLGFAPDAIVVDEEEDWERIPRTKRMALISQSDRRAGCTVGQSFKARREISSQLAARQARIL